MKTEWEEVLERVWVMEEEGRHSLAEVLEEENVSRALLDEMVQAGLIKIEGDEVYFTPEGKDFAATIIRRHRLAERLMHDVLDMKKGQIETDACEFEHFLSPEACEAICTLLGHPRECPHGKPIPPGECCLRAAQHVSRIVVPLSELRVGERGRIVYISTRRAGRIGRLTALGLLPGTEVVVRQIFPSCVLDVGQTQVALDKEVLNDIYVRRMPKMLPGMGRGFRWGLKKRFAP